MKKWLTYIFLIISLTGVLLINFWSSQHVTEEENINIITQNVATEIHKAEAVLATIQEKLPYESYSLSAEDYANVDVFIYKRSKLHYWSQNRYELDSRKILLENKSALIQHNEFGDFILLKGRSLNFTIVVSIPIQRKYKTNNRFITDGINPNIFNEIEVAVKEVAEGEHVIAHQDLALFSVVFNSANSNVNVIGNSALYLLLSSFLLITAFFTLKWTFENTALIIIALTLIRTSIFLLSPVDMEGILFNPTVFASSLIHPNLYELFVNLVYVTLVFYMLMSKKRVVIKLSMYIFVAVNVFLFLFLYDTILNSSFLISPFSLINLDLDSWVLLLPVLYICLVLCISIVYLANYKKCVDNYIVFILLQLLAISALYLINEEVVIPYVLFTVLAFVYVKFKAVFNTQLFYLTSLLLLSFVISTYKFQKEESGKGLQRLEIGSNIFEGSDPYLEYLINDVSERISKDKIIISKLKSPLLSADNLIIKKIKKVYLQNYFEGYEFDIQIVSLDQVVRYPRELKVKNMLYRVDKKEFNDLYQIQKEGISPYRDYIKLVWFDEANLVKNIFIRFTEKETNKYSVIPQLLFDEGRGYESLENVSFALLKDDAITYQEGDFDYSTDNVKGIINGGLTTGKYSHNVISKNEEKLIVSTPNTTVREFADYFSFIAIIMIMFFFIWYILNVVVSKRKMQFADRVQVAMSFFVLLNVVSLLVVVVTSFNSTYKEQVATRYSEVAKNVSSSLNSILSKDNLDRSRIAEKIAFMAKNQDVDIHLYNKEGTLLMSSLPELFEKKLISEKINFNYFNKEQTVVASESIGDFQFSSAYSPIMKDGEMLGVVNIPFFSADEELMNSIDGMIYTIFDISLLIIGFFLLISNLLANRITKPLQLLKENFESVTLMENKQINWKSDDEIGGLVKSYNSMLSKLSESKEKLKEQEKQNAWKEMAKQVAHEIKNPLTPMKLSLQFLQQKMSKSETEENKELSKSTEAIIDQIDNLADIVSSFSEFATMPEYQLEAVDLKVLVGEVSELHSQSAQIKLTNFDSIMLVKCDKKALKGILTNVIINGIQSVANKEPVIYINCTSHNDNMLIGITDNGEGIAEEIRDQVFTPNFSTKYSGSGIGLALAKQGIEHFGGRIWFESNSDAGTTFYIELPLSK